MRNKNANKLIGIVLTICMLFTLFPASGTVVYAESELPMNLNDGSSTSGALTFIGESSTKTLQAASAHSHGLDGKAGEVAFNEWTATDSLPTVAGNYYLKDNVSLKSDAWVPNDGIVLCLNGKSIIQETNYAVILLNGEKTLTICDCSGTPGSITHSADKTGTGVSISGGTLNLYGGTISGNTSSNGGGVNMTNTGTFNMYGGTISNNTATSDGGGVRVYKDSTFNMHGGTISENNADRNGGGVYVDYYNDSGSHTAAFNMSGGIISSNTAGEKGGGIYHDGAAVALSGDVTITGNKCGSEENALYLNNLYLVEKRTITIGGELKNTTPIGITVASPPTEKKLTVDIATFKDGVSPTDYSKNFTSDKDGCEVAFDSDKLVLKEQSASAHTHNGLDYSMMSPNGQSMTISSGTQSIALSGNCSSTGIEVGTGATLNLCLNGKTLDMDSNDIYVNTGGTLNIYDCQATGGSITSTGDCGVNNNGVFTLFSGSINTAGTGVSNQSAGTVTINGGSIEGKHGIWQDSAGTITINGGEIIGTGSESYGIQSRDSGKITITSGTVSGAAYGIYQPDLIYASGEIEMTGGTVRGEKAGIYSRNDEYKENLTISGGTVWGGGYTEGDTAPTGTTGIGIYNDAWNIAINNDAKVLGARKGIDSGYGCLITMTGGTVSGGSGSGIGSIGTVKISGGTVTGGTYGIENYESGQGIVYLSGEPNISGNEVTHADLYSGSTSTHIYAYEKTEATPTAPYMGGNLTVKVSNPPNWYNNSFAIIEGVTDGNKDKFSLVNTAGNYFLKRGTGNNANNLVLAVPHTHSWATAWSSDGTAHWHECEADGCDGTKNSYATHTPEDDGDCTSAVICETCKYEFTEAKTHSFTTTKSATQASAATCLANQFMYAKCDNCDVVSDRVTVEVANTKLSHTWSSDWNSDSTAHWHNCTVTGCPLTDNAQKDGYAAHTPETDDGKCTTAVLCSVCDAVTTAANASHSYDNACDTVCNNTGCTAGNRVTSHDPEEDDGNCKTEVICSVCDEVTTEAETDHSYTYTVNGNVMTESCSNAGCTVHSATATVTAPAGILIAGGTAEFPVAVVYSDNWAGSKDVAISYTKDGAAVTDTKGAGTYTASITVGGKTATVSYTVQAAPVQSATVTVTVTDKNNAVVENAAVTLSGTNGTYTATGTGNVYSVTAPKGDYQLVVEATISNEPVKVTQGIQLGTADAAISIQLPAGEKISEVETIGEDTPTVVVKGLEELAVTDTTSDSNTAHEDTDKVQVTLAVEKEEEDTTDDEHTAIKEQLATEVKDAKADFFDLTLTKIVNDSDITNIGDKNNKVLEILIPFDFTGKTNVKIYRYHGSSVDAFTKIANRVTDEAAFDDGTYFIGDGYVAVYASKFSVYAIGYEEVSNDGGGSVTPPSGSTPDNSYNDDSDDDTVTVPTKAPWNPFLDVPEHEWYYDVVKEVYDRGWMVGTSDKVFSPNGGITRGMFVATLWRAEGEPAAAQKATYGDIVPGAYYEEAVNWGDKYSIIYGYSADVYAPNQIITREQAAAILYRYAHYKGYDTSVGADTNILSYVDAFDITEYAIPAMQWALGDGVLSGRGNGVLDPLSNATRAEAMAMLLRLMDEIEG